MNFQIKSLVLWPRNHTFAPRVLPFTLGAVNVISGASRTGKSAVVPIIDYCLGSESCAIPVGIIREKCEWFGVVVATDEGEKLFARREPGDNSATGDMYVSEAQSVAVPERLEKNITVDALKSRLDRLAGLSTLDFSQASAGTGFTSRIGFRDLMGFLFQAQNVIANPNVLFYKADSYQHQERFKVVIPYVLGAITPELLAVQHELKEVERQLQAAERDLRASEQTSAEFRGRLSSLLIEATELGLLASDTSTGSVAEQLAALASIVQMPAPEPKPSITGLEDVEKEFEALKAQESSISSAAMQLYRRQHEILSLRGGVEQFRSGVALQKERLAISDWLIHQLDGAGCPLCGSSYEPTTSELRGLVDELQKLERTAANFDVVPDTLDREAAGVREKLNAVLEQLRAVQLQIREMENRSAEVQSSRFTEQAAARFLGRLETNLAVLGRVSENGELRERVDALRERVEPLRRVLTEAAIRSKERAAIETVDNFAGRFIKTLDAEHPDLPIRFQRSDLSIKVVRGNREDYLWELGSGSNWLSYHVAIALAFQYFFQSMHHSPVPNFIVMDQPSQVYFPKTLAENRTKDDPDPKFTDDDVIAVRKVFDTLSQATRESKKPLQIIVLDHAAETVWAGLPNIELAAEWRTGEKLVPDNWV